MERFLGKNRIGKLWLTGLASCVFSLFQNGSVYADNVIADDLIVTGSGCIGFDCVNDESFGFDTLRLKENNLRIRFDDTSATAGFPANDWEITINDSSSGGANKFSITDVSGGRVPVAIEAGAPSNSLYLDDYGRLGLGTSIPVVPIHLVKGDTPAIRLDQDGSSGWSPQVWDIAGNESNFFIRDVTNGSKMPFRMQPGAPTNSLTIKSSGSIGIGTWSPSQTVHVQGNQGSTQMLVEETSATKTPRTLLSLRNNGNSMIEMANTANNKTWTLSGGLNFLLKNSASTTILTADEYGNVVITGQLTTSGTTCSSGCDAVFSENHLVETIEDHAVKMWSNSYLPAVGPTVENEPFNLTAKTGGMLNELEKAHIYIEQLHKRLSERENQLDQLAKRIEKLEKIR